MKLDKVKICNYRSFGEEQTLDIDELTTIIGNNSSGKTAALSAINLLFSHNPADRVIKRSDFHIPKDINPEEVDKLNMYIEAIFTFPELDSDEFDKSSSIPLFFKSMAIDSPTGLPFIRIRLIGTWERSSNLDGSIEIKVVYIKCQDDEDIEKNSFAASRKELDSIRVIYVPAVRDPSKQLKNVSGTMIHQILSSVQWNNNTKKDIQNLIDQLNIKYVSENGVKILSDLIKKQWINYDSDNRYSNAVLRFNSMNIESLIKNSDIYFSPTVTEKEYTIDEMGDGLRSLFYISMVNSILDLETYISSELEEKEESERYFSRIPPVLTIIALEEPENHISPQLLGKLVNNFKNIAEKSNAQVVISSHSPAIVKRIETENIRYFRMKETLNTEIRRITLPDSEKLEDQYKYIKESVRAYPELFFSKLVILGEGDSEEIILSRFLEAHGNKIDSSGISVVPLGGRHVNHFWRLLSDLKIPYITLLDLDRERNGGGWGRIKYVLQQLIKLGCSEDELLRLENGLIITKQKLEDMHKWDVENIEEMDLWITKLEDYHVFFSYPLDIDFMMLEEFLDEYIKILSKGEGPFLLIGKGEKVKIDKDSFERYPNEYKERLKSDIRNVLKENGRDGNTFNEQQKQLMVWYKYFFFNRGKPTTHILLMSMKDDEYLCEHTPKVLSRMINRAKILLNSGGMEIDL